MRKSTVGVFNPAAAVKGPARKPAAKKASKSTNKQASKTTSQQADKIALGVYLSGEGLAALDSVWAECRKLAPRERGKVSKSAIVDYALRVLQKENAAAIVKAIT